MKNGTFANYEPLGGKTPHELLDRHPDGCLVGLRCGYPVEHAGVWDCRSGKLIWGPDGTSALCWMAGGQQVLLLKQDYERSPDHPPMIVTPLQSEYRYSLERRSWPEKTLIHASEIRPPTGWLGRVVASPRGNLAVVSWFEQHCAGFMLVALGEDEDAQLEDATYRTEPNWISGPVFSPDGRYLALSCGRPFWWNQEDPETPSAGGRFEIGHVTIFEVDTCTYREILLEEEVPAGWPPGDPGSGEWETLGEPRFLSDGEFIVDLPTGKELRFRTTEAYS